MSQDQPQRLTKNERRQQAREQARKAREREQKREKRNRLLLQGGVLLAIVAILAIVGVVVANSLRPAGPGPKNMASGAVVIGKDLKVKPTAGLPSDGKRKAGNSGFNKKPLPVTMYFDYMCPGCGAVEQQYGDMLEQYTGSGDIQLALYPVNFLDGMSAGTKYSSRASNLFSCVVEQQPKKVLPLHKKLLSKEVQPEENSAGLTDEQLLKHAKQAGVKITDSLKRCVHDRPFVPFVTANTKQATERAVLEVAPGQRMIANPQTGQLQDAKKPQRLVSTPTVIVNGKQWIAQTDGDLEGYILKQIQNIDAKETEKG